MRRGGSLVEILVVIVVFLVGILAAVQIFPPGLRLLARTADTSAASLLVDAELRRIESEGVPSYVATMGVDMSGGSPAMGLDPHVNPADRGPMRVAGVDGRIDSSGNLLIGDVPVGRWTRFVGPNMNRRIVGERQPLPAPTTSNGERVALVHLDHGPIDLGTVDAPMAMELVSVSGPDYRLELSPAGPPPTFVDPGAGVVYSVPRAASEGTPFVGDDQIWVRPAPGTRTLRVWLAATVTSGPDTRSTERTYDVDVTLSSPAVAFEAPFVVISLQGLAGAVNPSLSSVRVRSMYRMIGTADPFEPSEPLTYKVTSPELGTLALNPGALNLPGADEPVSIDYTVFDWTVLTEDFRVPTSAPFESSLSKSSLMRMSENDIDGVTYPGIGVDLPLVDGSVGATDFALMHVESGAVLLGNDGLDVSSSYSVNGTRGRVALRDVDDDPTNGLSVFVSYPVPGGWGPPTFVADISGQTLRAKYRAKGFWAVSPRVAAERYSMVVPASPSDLRHSEFFVGVGANDSTDGAGDRLYFPLADLGLKVTVGEMWVDDGSGARPIRDALLSIEGVQNLGGVDLAYADLSGFGAGLSFAYPSGASPVSRVRGASTRAIASFNGAGLNWVDDPEANFERAQIWTRGLRSVERETFAARGDDR